MGIATLSYGCAGFCAEENELDFSEALRCGAGRDKENAYPCSVLVWRLCTDDRLLGFGVTLSLW
jgi:hypothetical protein